MQAQSTINVPADYSTVQAAINAASSGDEIIIAAGTYNEDLSINGKDLTVTGAGIGQTVIQAASNQVTLSISNTTVATVIQHLSLKNGFDGVSASSPFTITMCEVANHVHDGVAFEDGSGGSITNCDIHDNGDDGIDIDHRVDVLVEDNYIHNNGSANENGQDGIEIRLHNDSIPSTLNIIIRENIIDGNAENGIQIIDHSNNATNRYLTIERNVICNNQRAGIGMMNNGATDEDYRAASIREPIDIINNTIAGNNHGISGGDATTAVNNLIINNTVLGTKQINGGSEVDYNLYFGNGSDDLGSNLDSENIFNENPVLSSNYELTEFSPAVNGGDPSIFCIESGSICDIGANEFFFVLPVELVDFSSELQDQSVTLNWVTGSETNNAGFYVEMSSSNREFAPVGFVAGNGTINTESAYAFEIKDLVSGNYLFRLKQIDFDGSTSFSNELDISLELPQKGKLYAAYPNPFNSTSSVQFSVSEKQNVQVELYDTTGKLVRTLFKGAVQPSQINKLAVDSEGLNSGAYLVQILGDEFSDSQVISLIK